jgi:hypothetical protein
LPMLSPAAVSLICSTSFPAASDSGHRWAHSPLPCQPFTVPLSIVNSSSTITHRWEVFWCCPLFFYILTLTSTL